MTNLGASLGTALAGSVLIASLTTSFIALVLEDPAVPPEVSSQAAVELASGIPFVSNAQLETALSDAGVDPTLSAAIVEDNEEARIDGLRAGLSVLAVVAVIALYFTRLVPTVAVGRETAPAH
jgi:hypothetical protein